MKKLSILLSAAVILSLTAFAFAKPGFSGGGGGVSFVRIQPDLGPLNLQIVQMGIPELEEGMFLYGGHGYGYVNRNFRIGGMGAGGMMTTSGYIPGAGGAPSLAKEVEFDIGYGGVTLEYCYNTPIGIQVFAGGLIGWGGISVTVSQFENSLSWNGIWEDYHTGYTGNSFDQVMTMNNSLFVLNPWVGAFYKVLPWMGVAGKAGYFYSTAPNGDWKALDSEIYGAPEIDLSNVSFEVNITFGG